MKQLLLTEIPVNYSVPPADRIRLTKQERIIYRLLLKHTVVSNIEMHEISHAQNVSARISNIRKYLKPDGQTVKIVERWPNGVNFYKIVQVEE